MEIRHDEDGIKMSQIRDMEFMGVISGLYLQNVQTGRFGYDGSRCSCDVVEVVVHGSRGSSGPRFVVVHIP